MKKFNGYIYIDDEIEVGDKVMLDIGHVTCSEVIVTAMGKIFATVRAGDMTWNVMRGRLTAIPKKVANFSGKKVGL